MTQNTGIRPEAELETLLSAALATAFPLVPRDGFTNQKRFTVTLGREPHEVDGMRLWQAEGRADIIISKDGRPLAVVEVKREDKTLTDDDRKQGLSYAALLTPRPPLVIVTNGATTRIYDTSSGEPWVRDGDGDEVIAKLFENASKMAAAAMSWAVETLMRTGGISIPLGIQSTISRPFESSTPARISPVCRTRKWARKWRIAPAKWSLSGRAPRSGVFPRPGQLWSGS